MIIKKNPIILFFLVILFLFVSGQGEAAASGVIEVTLEPVVPEHGFFTNEDEVLLNITVYNRSNQNMIVHVNGTYTYLTAVVSDYHPDIEPEDIELLPGQKASFFRTAEKRWEGLWQVSVIAYATMADGTKSQSGDVALYNVHPVSDRFAQETAEAPQTITFDWHSRHETTYTFKTFVLSSFEEPILLDSFVSELRIDVNGK